jgi:glycosyltransferase involved in cell wall biosynthesis
MPLTVLSVSYPLARVSGKSAGGAEQILSILDRASIPRGHRSIVLAPAGSRCDGLLVPVAIPSGALDENAKREARTLFREALRRALKRFHVDVVHMHGVDCYEYLPDCEIPIVITLHLPLDWYSPFALLDSRFNLTRICVSRTQAQSAPRGAKIDRVINNGVDLHRFCPARKRGNYALAIGRICPEKGLHLAIDAAQRAGIRLVIAGTVFDYPEHREYFNSQIAPRLGGQISFIGNVSGERKAKLLAGAKCLLLPSLAAETSSLVAMEAAAAGTPVIAWRSGALPEIVSNRRTGFLVSSVEEIIEAMRQVESIDPETCRAEAERRFASTKMASEYFALYNALTSPVHVPELVAA